MLIAAMNPCPCGYRGSNQKACTCTANDLLRYKKKLSGPIVDRIDLWVPVGHIEYSALHRVVNTKESAELRATVTNARALQQKRFTDGKTVINARMQTKEIQALVPLAPELQHLLEMYAKKT